jgi:hypothetical protein
LFVIGLVAADAPGGEPKHFRSPLKSQGAFNATRAGFPYASAVLL